MVVGLFYVYAPDERVESANVCQPRGRKRLVTCDGVAHGYCGPRLQLTHGQVISLPTYIYSTTTALEA